MTGRTHATIGANIVWLTVIFGMVDQFSIVFIIVGALVALLPDVDAVDSYIHHLSHGATRVIRGSTEDHRTFFHSLIPVLIILIVSLIFLSKIHTLFPWIIALAYFSHIFLDGLNPYGVKLFYPKKKWYHFLPFKKKPKTKGLFDNLLFFGGVLMLLFFLMFYYLPVINESISNFG